MSLGRVKIFKNDKGYGFIDCSGTDYFFHLSQCGGYVPKVNDEVEFIPVETEKGWAAHEVSKVEDG